MKTWRWRDSLRASLRWLTLAWTTSATTGESSPQWSVASEATSTCSRWLRRRKTTLWIPSRCPCSHANANCANPSISPGRRPNGTLPALCWAAEAEETSHLRGARGIHYQIARAPNPSQDNPPVTTRARESCICKYSNRGHPWKTRPRLQTPHSAQLAKR